MEEKNSLGWEKTGKKKEVNDSTRPSLARNSKNSRWRPKFRISSWNISKTNTVTPHFLFHNLKLSKRSITYVKTKEMTLYKGKIDSNFFEKKPTSFRTRLAPIFDDSARMMASINAADYFLLDLFLVPCVEDIHICTCKKSHVFQAMFSIYFKRFSWHNHPFHSAHLFQQRGQCYTAFISKTKLVTPIFYFRFLILIWLSISTLIFRQLTLLFNCPRTSLSLCCCL